MVDILPSVFQQPSRDTLSAKWRRRYSFRNPNADVGQNSEPWIRSQMAADGDLPLYAYAGTIAASTNWQNSTGDNLTAWLVRLTGSGRLPAVGAVGYVQIGAGVGGTTLQAGDILTVNSLRYKIISGGLYTNGALVGIIGVDTGPQTDQEPGTLLTFSTLRPGCNPTAVVVAQPDGTGLVGGANAESDADAKRRLTYLASHPTASGNDAQYQWILLNTPGLAIQQGFTYPGCMGPGSTGVTFTLRPSQPGANRIPSSVQLTIALGYLQARMPATDSIFMVALLGSPLTIALKTSWSSEAADWIDASPFPLYQSPGNNWQITNAVPATPQTFNIKSLTDTTVPQAGQSIALFDVANSVFQRKQILSATAASGGYTIVVDPTNGASDLTYTPFVGQLICPWSDSLDSLVDPLLAYFDSVGPGEQFDSFFDDGLRQKRSPLSPQDWSSQVANRMLGGPPNAALPPDPNAAPTPTLLSTPEIEDVIIEEPAIPYPTPVGSPGVSAYLLQVGSIVAFPE